MLLKLVKPECKVSSKSASSVAVGVSNVRIRHGIEDIVRLLLNIVKSHLCLLSSLRVSVSRVNWLAWALRYQHLTQSITLKNLELLFLRTTAPRWRDNLRRL
jgi:hypothetical protein